MRDLLITVVVFASIPLIFRKPIVGALMWTWLSLMNPHRLAWNYAVNFPYAQVVAIAFLLSLLTSKEPKKLPWSPLLVVWAIFVVWTTVTTVFALHPEAALTGWLKMIKIQLMSFCILLVMTNENRLRVFTWVTVLSVGFFGFKGGLFAFRTGGEHIVWGPRGSEISGNNELALALVVLIPFMWFLQLHTQVKWQRWGLVMAMALCTLTIVTTYSRGAFIAVSFMALFLVLKSRHRLVLLGAVIVVGAISLTFVPDKWFDRMATIQHYEQDSSAMGRINAWIVAWRLAKDHPITGGGFRTFSKSVYQKYAPDPSKARDVHSIYFEVLGEHGFPGLFLFLLLGLMAYGSAGWTARRARGDPSLAFHGDLARMTQVSLVGFGVGGAFLGLAYFDLIYDVLIIHVTNRMLLERKLGERSGSVTTRPDALSAGGNVIVQPR